MGCPVGVARRPARASSLYTERDTLGPVSSGAELLRTARQAAGLSQTELARRSGVAQSVVSAYEAGKRQPALPTLSKLIEATGHTLAIGLQRSDSSVRGLPDSPLGRKLRQHRRALLEAVADAGGRNLRVFGSVARGQDTATSDVDLLVDLPEGTGLFAVQALEGRLRRILKADVDLAPPTSLKPRVRAEAETDAISL